MVQVHKHQATAEPLFGHWVPKQSLVKFNFHKKTKTENKQQQNKTEQNTQKVMAHNTSFFGIFLWK